MRCSEFREHHCAFVDDTLAGVELVRMQGHVNECCKCAELDARVRRSLMLARSLPTIEPSADFARKLEVKLQACRNQREEVVYSNFRAVATIGAVASLLMIGYMAESLRTGHSEGTRQSVARDIVLPPVIAMADRPIQDTRPDPSAGELRSTHRSAELASTLSQPEIVAGSGLSVMPPAGNGAVPEIIASVSAGMPLWPAALFAEQAPIHFVSYRKTVH